MQKQQFCQVHDTSVYRNFQESTNAHKVQQPKSSGTKIIIIIYNMSQAASSLQRQFGNHLTLCVLYVQEPADFLPLLERVDHQPPNSFEVIDQFDGWSV